MGNKEWPDDWKVGNSAARGCLMFPASIIIAFLIAMLIRWLLGIS